ncbi:MAG: DNA-3-methyladenine glycosylase 2 family protein [Anaerolineales bacterium]
MDFEIIPSGPFKLANSNEYFGGWFPYETGELSLAMAFPMEGWAGSALVVVREGEGGRIRGEVHGAGAEAERAWQQALAALSLDVDGSGWAAVGQRDPAIGRLQERYNFLRPVLFHSPYEAAAAFIIGHRIRMEQGRAIRQAMAREFGEAVGPAGHEFYAFPRPQVLATINAVKGVNPQKIERLHAVAQAALDGRLDRAALRAMPVELALAQLQALPGIGPFFAQGILFRGAGLTDEVTDDETTAQAVQQLYGPPALPDRKAILAQAEAWRPYRMWATVLLHVWLRRERGGPVREPRKPRK